MIDPMLIERIYEAAALFELWPEVLQHIADSVGSLGATFVAQTAGDVSILGSPRVERIVDDFFAEGWANDPDYAAPLLADLYPGFRTETHYRTIEEIERLPVHVHFLAPRGLIGVAGTILQGAKDDSLRIAFEGFPTYAAAEAGVPMLDPLRAPLARALSLTARLRGAESGDTVAALELAGVAAAVVSSEGRLRAANDHFVKRLGDRMIERPSGLRFADRFLQAQFAETLRELRISVGVRSIAVAATDDHPPCVIHLLPLKRGARDVFGWDGVLMLLAEAANASVPNADLLRLLFDLTPAEARLTRLLVEGCTLSEAARTLAITEATGRVHLRRVFAKTGVARQAELVRLLLGLGGPA